MANNFTITLDTTAPAGVTLSIESGASYATAQLVDLAIGCSDGDKTGYQMLIWGDVDTTNDANVQDVEGNSVWISYAATKQIKLSAAEESKTIYVKVRDRVWNVSSQASDTITLDLSAPVVTIGTPDATEISKVAGKNTVSCAWQVDCIFDEYKVMYVASAGAAHNAGTNVQIPTTAGSSNVSGSVGDYPATTNITTTIKGSDLETASAGDGDKIIKIFVKDKSGQWSA